MKMTRGISQREASLEHDARQPRLAMEADGPANTKTRERTEGVATVVQAMRGDSCTADRVDPDPMCSTSSGGDCTGPPAPSCSGENALIDNRAAAPKSYLSKSWRCAHHQPPVAYSPPAKPPRQRRSPSISHLFSSTRPRRRIENFYELQFHPPGTTAASGNCLLLPPAGELLKTKSGQNRTFDSGGSQGRFRAFPFMGTWRALPGGEVVRVRAAGGGCSVLRKSFAGSRKQGGL